ncbi:MAG: HAD family hydrolase [Methanomicrobium sp.]|nr:HAD family hydrolase [Methanomicrobium sp.]
MTLEVCKYDVIMLDFDGVILESVSVKTETFRKLFADKTDYVDIIVNFHIQNGGMSRFDKFRYIYSEILHEELTETRFNSLCDNFAKYVYEGVINSPFVKCADKFIEKCYRDKIPLYLVSATPEEELIQITKDIGIYDKFNHVYGSPMTKADCITQILQENNITQNPHKALFFGDAINDYKAANKTGISFAGRVPEGNLNIFEGLDGVVGIISDFSSLID